MLFNSLDFAIFLPIVFGLYWATPAKYPALRNLVLLVASYFFYGWWDWRFLFLRLFTSTVDYAVGLGIARASAPGRRKALLALTVGLNLGLLGLFKYYDFFVDSFADIFTILGVPVHPASLGLVLPVGISFYTFQTIAYGVDVYRGKVEPCRKYLDFLTFASFFPQLLAGPIERAENLLPQFVKARQFDERTAVDGLRQILWGLFKKIVVADNCAEIANQTFSNPGSHSASTLLIGALFYSFQIYGDFSGYSDMAIGTARLFGIELGKNFAFPYFSRDIAEFWRRWHISLTTWFRDYVYIPLGGSRGSRVQKIRNTVVVFLVSGLWHGANWTFVVWGGLHALFFLPLLLTDTNRRYVDIGGGALPRLGEVGRMLATFGLVTLAWVFFRADTVEGAFTYLAGMVSPSLFSWPELGSKKTGLLIALMLCIEWVNRLETHGLVLERWRLSTSARWSGYAALVLLVLFFGGSSETFIYFQF
jgi:alginate O-acetyltransferase complex protein AlgI